LHLQSSKVLREKKEETPSMVIESWQSESFNFLGFGICLVLSGRSGLCSLSKISDWNAKIIAVVGSCKKDIKKYGACNIFLFFLRRDFTQMHKQKFKKN